MKIKTIRLKKNSSIFLGREKDMKGMIILMALFCAGMIIGAGIVKNERSEWICGLTSLFESHIKIRAEQKMYTTFFNSLLVNMSMTAIPFIFGMSCIGVPVSALIPTIKGLGTGLVAGTLFSRFGMSGIGYYLLTILPGAVLSVSALLTACNCSGSMSADILLTISGKKQAEQYILPNYIKKYFVLFALTALSAVFDAILTSAFSYLFVF